MIRVPYELVVLQADRLTVQAVQDYWERKYVSRLDDDFVEACGWSPEELDRETLHRVDRFWIDRVRYSNDN